MTIMKFSARALVLASSALLPLCDVAQNQVQAQDQNQSTVTLPQINVTAPSPIVHRRPTAPSREAAPARQAGTTPAPAPAPAPLPGTVPIVSDQFATVTVVRREEIARSPVPTPRDL